MATIINTVNVAVPVSRRDAQFIRDASWRTCLTNCAGVTLAIDSCQFKFFYLSVLVQQHESGDPLGYSALFVARGLLANPMRHGNHLSVR